MPGKSRHGKGKHHHQSKKSKAIRRQGTTAAAPASTETPATAPVAAAPPAKVQPSTKAAGTPAKPAAIEYPYALDELKRIGILAGIAVIVLFILSFIIS
jgi:predicted flap endonuclease-1-like 5' DNA nuclease